MAGYVSPPPPHPLGQRRAEFEEIREKRGLTPSGYRQDGTDPEKSTKEELEREMYERANSKVSSLASALGASTGPGDAEDTAE
ncbi:hypothetical protein FIU86_04840 [Roseovarius sp. THAF9]|uniref:hypothetical protein n=1 Tax=Roseovarius sp. THAF9 TaxID=2587847 RepID=UPI0012679F5C|nr:hypothetical protein [Roseovarius sp. THAF9]QFT92158.1 hypothetical protein FIU86_04840 [Roseovarius sp. THAF9]